jgi:fumarate hydratase subunit beta
MRSGKSLRVFKIQTPIDHECVRELRSGDQIELNGTIYCGRDAVLPVLAKLAEQGDLARLKINLEGAVIFHTAVSQAGIGPTTSNKVEIESSIPALSKAGVRMHIGKGILSPDTVEALNEYGSLFAVTPPVSALLTGRILSKRVAAFKKEGMEAFHELEVYRLPAIVAAAHGKTIFQLQGR